MAPALTLNLTTPMDSAPNHQISFTQPHEHLRKWTRGQSLPGSPLHLATGDYVEGNHNLTSKGLSLLAPANQMGMTYLVLQANQEQAIPKSRYYHGVPDPKIRIYGVGMKKKGVDVFPF